MNLDPPSLFILPVAFHDLNFDSCCLPCLSACVVCCWCSCICPTFFPCLSTRAPVCCCTTRFSNRTGYGNPLNAIATYLTLILVHLSCGSSFRISLVWFLTLFSRCRCLEIITYLPTATMFRSTKVAALKASAVRVNGLRSIHNISRPQILSQSSSKRLTTRRPLALVGGERAWSQQRHYAVSAEETSKGVVSTDRFLEAV